IEVINSHTQSITTAAAKMGHISRIQRRSPGQYAWIAAVATATPKIAPRNNEYKRASGGNSLFGAHRCTASATATATGTARRVRSRGLGAETAGLTARDACPPSAASMGPAP